jgi:signal transduction histidine kinase
LIENSVHACKGYGTVEINIYDKPEDIEIFYSDTGPGIPEEIRDKIFESFFTTKKGDMGTGLGLYISKKIVEELNGNIETVNKKGKGACFRITFPKQGDNNDKINIDS